MNVNKFVEKINKVDEKNVELSSMKVELGLVEDIAKLSEQSRKVEEGLRTAKREGDIITAQKVEIEKQYEKLVKEENKYIDAFFKEEKKVDPILAKIDAALSKARSAANDLGIKVATIQGYSELERDAKNLSNARVGK